MDLVTNQGQLQLLARFGQLPKAHWLTASAERSSNPGLASVICVGSFWRQRLLRDELGIHNSHVTSHVNFQLIPNNFSDSDFFSKHDYALS